MIRPLLIATAGAALCTAAISGSAHADTKALKKAFTVTQLELKAGKLVGTGVTSQANALITIQPFGKTVKSGKTKAFSFAFPVAPAKLASCTAIVKLGTAKETLPISSCGQQGKAGPAGPKGDIGPIGPKGETGAIGPKGDAGAKGDTGPKGDVGAKGDTGPAGPQGPTGIVAIKNLYGDVVTISYGNQWFNLAPSVKVSLAADQRVTLIANSALSSTGAAATFELGACYAKPGQQTTTLLPDGGIGSNFLTLKLAAVGEGYRGYGISTSAILPAGDYNISMCARSRVDPNIKIVGDFVQGLVMISN